MWKIGPCSRIKRTVKELEELTDVVKQGWLMKRQSAGSKWDRRYCVLTPVALYYFDSPEVGWSFSR